MEANRKQTRVELTASKRMPQNYYFNLVIIIISISGPCCHPRRSKDSQWGRGTPTMESQNNGEKKRRRIDVVPLPHFQKWPLLDTRSLPTHLGHLFRCNLVSNVGSWNNCQIVSNWINTRSPRLPIVLNVVPEWVGVTVGSLLVPMQESQRLTLQKIDGRWKQACYPGSVNGWVARKTSL